MQGIPFPVPEYERESALSSEAWLAYHRQRPGSYTGDHFGSESWFYPQQAADAMQALFAKHALEGGASVQGEQLRAMQAELFELAPRLGSRGGGGSKPADGAEAGNAGGGAFPSVLLSCTNLRRLKLSFQGIIALPDSIGRLQKLVELDLDYCIRLETISGELGTI